jgi:hypothetical protein
MKFNRRIFLEQTGLALLSLGFGEAIASSLSNNRRIGNLVQRYQQTLAQTTQRKLALLVGINSYPQNHTLSGCLTDVELQRELLIHRFGFKNSDILVLTEQQATRENIETAFLEHLSQQAQADDVVVFHFSGYGNRVKIASSSTLTAVTNNDASTPSYQLVNSLMPVDSILATKEQPIANELLEDTLMLLARSLPTDKLTAIFDTSYVYPGKPLLGNLRPRSWANISEQLNPEELAFSEQLRLNLNNRKSLAKLPLSLRGNAFTIPGTILASAGKGQIATEISWDGFSAGLFTYALTQYLWEVTPASKIQIAIARTSQSVELITGKKQQPVLQGQSKPLLAYYSLPVQPIGAEGAIAKIDEKGTVYLHLNGLPATILRHYGNNSRFQLSQLWLDNSETSANDLTLQIQSREGLTAKAQVLNSSVRDLSPQVGQLVRESVRVLPRHLGLSIALDNSLSRIERVDATSAFSSIDSVSEVVDVGTKAVDCLLGRIKQAIGATKYGDTITESDPVVSGDSKPSVGEGYGLLSINGEAIANTVGAANEAVKLAVNRLIPHLKTLLALKLWQLTLNQGSSRLAVNLTLESNLTHKGQILSQRRTTRSLIPPQLISSSNLTAIASEVESSLNLPVIANGDRLQLRIENLSDRAIYLLVFAIDANRQTFVSYIPSLENNLSSKSNLQSIIIAPQTTAIFPNPDRALPWSLSKSSGLVEIYAICSIAPFENTLATLSTPTSFKQDREQVIDLPNPLEASQALLADLHTASTSINEQLNLTSGIYALDTQAWATLSFVVDL